MSHFRNREIHVNAGSGEAIGDSINAALSEALDEDCPVVLTHNGRIFRIDPREILSRICTQESPAKTAGEGTTET